MDTDTRLGKVLLHCTCEIMVHPSPDNPVLESSDSASSAPSATVTRGGHKEADEANGEEEQKKEEIRR